ncbi:MAG TPA: Gfo/Idh/MocA family oxidoreductase [Solirubrobacteraceae bacterium]|nr:Gfo/Idh/MocA family oxidoreductase [Solirubrobacteraceae bacterium]
MDRSLSSQPAAPDPPRSPQAPTIGVGMLGYGFMGRAHSHALRSIRHMTWPPPLVPELVSIAGRTEAAVAGAAAEFGFSEHVTDWRALPADPRIGLFDNTGPNNVHIEPSIAAAEAGKHVVCEKPLGRTADESFDAWQRVSAAGVKHMCAFNYRFVPAVRLARDLIASGELGEILHFRGVYLQDWLVDPSVANLWRLDKSIAGSGALGDLGAHVIDLARYLVDEIATVSGALRTFNPVRDGSQVDVDDAFATTVEFDCGALGTIEASRFCAGRKNGLRLEVNGTLGSLAFNLERLNELELSEGTRGFRTILVTNPEHPYLEHWWPPGHVLGWEHTFVHELHHMLTAIRDDGDVAPHGATFQDGYRAAEVCDAIVRSSQTSEQVTLTYRDSDEGRLSS